jgi:hypothetical protein
VIVHHVGVEILLIIAHDRATPKMTAAVMHGRARATFRRKIATWRTKISMYGPRTTTSCRFSDDSAHALS